MTTRTQLDVMTELVDVLATKFNVNATIRWHRTREETEISSSTEYFVEPGEVSFKRLNVGACSVKYAVRIVAEKIVDYADADDALKTFSAFFQNLARNLMAAPTLSNTGAFLLGVSVFADAPTCASSAALDSGVAAVYGGVQLTFTI